LSAVVRRIISVVRIIWVVRISRIVRIIRVIASIVRAIVVRVSPSEADRERPGIIVGSVVIVRRPIRGIIVRIADLRMIPSVVVVVIVIRAVVVIGVGRVPFFYGVLSVVFRRRNLGITSRKEEDASNDE